MEQAVDPRSDAGPSLPLPLVTVSSIYMYVCACTYMHTCRNLCRFPSVFSPQGAMFQFHPGSFGEVMCAAGEPAGKFWVIVDGSVQVSTVCTDQKTGKRTRLSPCLLIYLICKSVRWENLTRQYCVLIDLLPPCIALPTQVSQSRRCWRPWARYRAAATYSHFMSLSLSNSLYYLCIYIRFPPISLRQFHITMHKNIIFQFFSVPLSISSRPAFLSLTCTH